MSNIRQAALITLAIVVLIGFGEYRDSSARHDSRVFFCNELETIKKGERRELSASIKDTRKYLRDVANGNRKRIPNITDEEIMRGLRRKERRLEELAPDIERCLSA
jgi:hypothetical protein